MKRKTDKLHSGLLAVLLAIFVLQGAVFAVSYVSVGRRSADTLARLEKIDRRITDESVSALANMLQTHLTAIEAVTDESLYNAAMALQELDKRSEMGQAQLDEFLPKLEVDELYLTDLSGDFIFTTVPEGVGLNIFDIYEAYRVLLDYQTRRLPSTIKVMVETGEIYKFMAVPRLDERGHVRGIAQSAIRAENIARQLETILASYPYIKSFHLFDTDKVCLISIETEEASMKFKATESYETEEISSVFADRRPVVKISEDSVRGYYLVGRDEFAVGSSYVMAFEIGGDYYSQNTRETAGALGLIQKNFALGMILVFAVSWLVIIAVVVVVLKVFHKRKIDEYRTQLMLSQIRPHFLYNSLTSISDLCEGNPEAQKALLAFSEYLRANMDSLSQNSPIPFEEELRHTRHYLWLEKLRFEERLNIEYDIAGTDCMLPPLTLQPIVENAVFHGIMAREAGGTVTIRAVSAGGVFCVSVADDGVGFDPSRPPSDGRPHLGIANVRFRLAALCGGALSIHSRPGGGTVAVIEIPERGEAL